MLQRRQVLLAKMTTQREQLVELSLCWQPAIKVIDQTQLVLRFVRRHPVLITGLSGIIILQRQGVTGLLKRGWQIWKIYRFVSKLSYNLTQKL